MTDRPFLSKGNSVALTRSGPKNRLEQTIGKMLFHWQYYLLILPPLAVLIIFSYGPMYGVQIAFKDYVIRQGIWGSKWIGLTHFENFLTTYNFVRLIKNTAGLSSYSLAAGFPIPIILAIMLNECANVPFKRTVQMLTYAPHFISTVIVVSMLMLFISPRSGMINNFIVLLGGQEKDYIGMPAYFKSLYVWSGVWQSMGFNSIIYLAALSGLDPQLHEAAIMDGASKIKRIWHIDLPGISPTIIILLILSSGNIMSVGFEKVYLMQNTLNMSVSDVIATYVYRIGLQNAQYSFSSAVGLFDSVVNAILLIIVNTISRRFSETSLW